MSVSEMFFIEVIEGPEESLGRRQIDGNPAEIIAYPAPEFSGIPPQRCIVYPEGDGLCIRPGEGAHVRLGNGRPWRECEKLHGEVRVEIGQVVYLGPLQRGLGLRLLGFNESVTPSIMKPAPRAHFRPSTLGAFIVLAVLLLWGWVLSK